MGTPDDIDVWIGLDIGKAEHFADVLDDAGSPLFSAAVANNEADIAALLDRAASFGAPALVVDQRGSLASLVLAVAARRGVPVAYVPGLVMRRAADLYPGEAKTDRRDAFVLADTGRTRRRQVHGLDARDDELLAQPRVLNGSTPTSRPTPHGSRTGCGMPSRAFLRPWSAFWAPRFTIRVSATCSPAIPCPKRWPRPAAVASHASFGSGRRASRTPLPRL